MLRLESRPKNIEGEGEITIRDLVRNSLRMRPDRIIVGEVRGAEALDMLQAMNTGHDGSLSTIHANTPRDALARIETMVLMAGYDLPVRAIRQQVASALDLIIHLERLEDGSRRVTSITEVQRMESDVITLQELFKFQIDEVTRGRHDRRRSPRHGSATELPPEVREARCGTAARALPEPRAGVRRGRSSRDGGVVRRAVLIAAAAAVVGVLASTAGAAGSSTSRRCSRSRGRPSRSRTYIAHAAEPSETDARRRPRHRERRAGRR